MKIPESQRVLVWPCHFLYSSCEGKERVSFRGSGLSSPIPQPPHTPTKLNKKKFHLQKEILGLLFACLLFSKIDFSM